MDTPPVPLESPPPGAHTARLEEKGRKVMKAFTLAVARLRRHTIRQSSLVSNFKHTYKPVSTFIRSNFFATPLWRQTVSHTDKARCMRRDIAKTVLSCVGQVFFNDTVSGEFIANAESKQVTIAHISDRTRFILEYCLGKSSLSSPETIFQSATYKDGVLERAKPS